MRPRRLSGGRGAQWAVARENYRRQLKRIHITGFLRGEAVDHYYDWINMRPRHLWRHFQGVEDARVLRAGPSLPWCHCSEPRQT